jgi:hypothetical protein
MEICESKIDFKSSDLDTVHQLGRCRSDEETSDSQNYRLKGTV